MKKFLVFITVLSSNFLIACGFYPYGEELRFSFLNPSIFNIYDFAEFNYSSNSNYPGIKYPTNYIFPNNQLWMKYCKNKVDNISVSDLIDEMSLKDIHSKSTNKMLKYLYQNKDLEAIAYLKFAKSCEYGNTWIDDPWERHEVITLPKRIKQVEKAIELSKKCKSKEIKLRYAFLAIRMSYYNQNNVKIKTIFKDNFELTNDKNIIYYWSLYFRTLAEKDNSLRNFYAAQVFAHAVDKRFMVLQQYDTNTAIEEVLKHAKSKEEKANVYFIAGVKKHDKTLDYLKKINKLQPNHKGLNFLLLREINKIEDWIFTPYYSLFQPSLAVETAEDISTKRVFNTIEYDRKYAKELLNFIRTKKHQTSENLELWNTCKAIVLFATKEHKNSLLEISKLKKTVTKNEALIHQLEIFEALNLVAEQKYDTAFITKRLETLLFKHKENKKLIFAIGKEFELKNNTTEAAILFSTLKNNYSDNYDSVYWKTIKNKKNTYSDYYENYFDYIDAIYTPYQTKKIIDAIKTNLVSSNNFTNWKYEAIRKDLSNLYDLVGTKYIRQNKLIKALPYFKKANADKVTCDNPFYKLEYTPSFIQLKKEVKFNKYTITKELIKNINKANQPTEINKDYYFFIIANCYYNMTQYGNCSIMRRYYTVSYGNETVIEDEKEFFENNLAKQYYKLAFKHAKTRKFKALCLKMIARCEKNKILSQREEYVYGNKYDSNLNKYYLDLKNNYTSQYEELVSNCDNFPEYFNARR
ncbi:hypothetical protein G6N05_01900 [Flavobacterium sp. F372]|uniref:Lipoprotein n=1 Tax=Flavobacterium bernardetii TaxID=2813823 RepID=A0ABR7IV64_9FLAO|nr:hypothetical protein [Flavobacterium bernardetii]MBC5833628.1 hypothetical protein [Flavobacterium bernardetii]NHF68861.1 hypothetical protein [Flavobacterium bernardetii]